ncbi:hypothetical protein T261_00332 [Streptomyces lydicus]|nr:hypothetical protein T261_00332 [Streptomyces lydicus]
MAVRLFEREGGRTAFRLTEAGERFLPAAHEALAAGERAVAAVSGTGPVMRSDAWGHLYAPMRTVAQVVQKPRRLAPRQSPSEAPARYWRPYRAGKNPTQPNTLAGTAKRSFIWTRR